MIEQPMYSREEIKRRLIWCRDHKDPPLKQICIKLDIQPSQIYRFVADTEKLSDMRARLLTDFFMKWDLGIYTMWEGKLIKTRNPKPKINMTADWRTGTMSFKTNPQVLGVKEWLGSAMLRLELGESNENISATPTDRLKGTKKSARAAVRRWNEGFTPR